MSMTFAQCSSRHRHECNICHFPITDPGVTMQPRIPGRNFLFVPGPTNVPDRVQRAMMVAMEDHRSSRFPELSLSVLKDLKKVFKTDEGKIFIFPSSAPAA